MEGMMMLTMNSDTIHLLQQCNAGCKSGTNSMEQVKPYVRNDRLKSIIEEYNDKHIKLGDECHQMLNEYHEAEKDPKVSAKAFSWVGTEMKLMINHDTHEIADLMIDGCNMGIKSVCGYINKYETASTESLELAKKLVRTEQEFLSELLGYL